ncbi:outer membrane lipoprotein carrier protein LolA [bacterium]|nr:outer membrane lipoprotein carrier protein LolA [bacterium]
MKNDRKKAGCIILIAFLCLVTSSSYGWTENWEQIKKEAGRIESISADFSQEKHLKILTRPLISKGILCFQKPDSLRWEYKTPVPSILVSHQGKTKQFIKENGVFVENSGANLMAMQFVLREITNWLSGHFDKNPDFKAVLMSNRRIVLQPEKKEMSLIITRIELLLSERPGLIESVKIYESEDSFTVLTFDKSELNKKIDLIRFQSH